MSNNKVLVGLDLGSSKIAALLGLINDDKNIEIIGVAQFDSDGIRKGVIVNLENTISCIRKVVDELQIMSGYKIESVYVGISGSNIESKDSFSTHSLNGAYITQKDLKFAINATKEINLPNEKNIIHTISKEFIVDGEKGIKDPTGMSCYRLETKVLHILANSSSVQNINKCIMQNNLILDGIIFNPLASSSCLLSQDEKELGVVLVDIGSGTSDIIIFYNGSPIYTSSIAIGGEYITRDLSVCLKTPYKEAEFLKKTFGMASSKNVNRSEMIKVSSVGGRDSFEIQKLKLVEVIEARLNRILNYIWDNVEKSGHLKKLNSGVVLTGGTSLLPDIDIYFESLINLPVRVSKPSIEKGLKKTVNNPKYSTSYGLINYAVNNPTLVSKEILKKNKKLFSNISNKVTNLYNDLFSN